MPAAPDCRTSGLHLPTTLTAHAKNSMHKSIKRNFKWLQKRGHFELFFKQEFYIGGKTGGFLLE